MMKIKITTGIMSLALALVLLTGTTPLEAKEATFSVSADEIDYDMQTGAGSASGKTTITQDGRVTVAGGGGSFNSKAKSAHLTGGIVSDKADEHLRSSELIMHNENYMSAVGNANITKGDKTLTAYRVDYHKDSEYMETSGSSARLSSTDGSWLNAGKITYAMQSGVANAMGGVTLASPSRSLSGSADQAVYETKDNGHIDLIGNAHATQDGNTVSGNKLRVYNTNSHTEATGNVKIVYYPKSQQPKTTAVALADDKQNDGSKNTKAGAKTHGTAKAEVVA